MIMRTGKAQGIKTNCIRLWGTLMLLFMLGMMRLPVYGAEEFSVQELSGEGTVTSDSLNIRSGPGTEYDVVGKAAKGTVLVVTGQADNGWYRIELEGKNGYASGKYITFEAKADVSEQDPQEQAEQTSGTGMGYISQRYIDYLKTAGIIFGMVVVVIMIFITLKGIGKSRREDEEYEDEEYEDDENYEDEYDDDDIDPKMERVTTILAIVAAVIIGVIALVLVANAIGIFKGGSKESAEETQKSVEVVNVVGFNIDAARSTLEELYLSVDVQYEESDEVPENIVIRQSIPKGEMVEEHSLVILTVSSGASGIEVPNVVGYEETQADTTLSALGFKVSKQTEYSDTVDEGYVIFQTPEALEKIASGSTVVLTISAGPAEKMVSVPDLRGMTESEAKAKLTASNLKVGTVTEDYSDAVTKGNVLSQSYSPETEIGENSSVNFVVSLGKKDSTYNYSASISAPDGYVDGSTVTITLTTASGEKKVYTTNSFPYTINETGLKSESGTISMSGTKKENQTVDTGTVDESGNPIYETVEADVPADFGSQNVTFTKAE